MAPAAVSDDRTELYQRTAELADAVTKLVRAERERDAWRKVAQGRDKLLWAAAKGLRAPYGAQQDIKDGMAALRSMGVPL